jgi:hypothetical protein
VDVKTYLHPSFYVWQVMSEEKEEGGRRRV